MVSKSALHKSVVLESSVAATERLCERLLAEAAANKFDGDDIFAIHLALEEAFINAVRHGNKQDEAKTVAVECLITPDKLDISIADEGAGFNPDSVPDPRSEENIYKPAGRGLLLMRSFMDVVEHNETGNCVHMVKYKSKPKNES